MGQHWLKVTVIGLWLTSMSWLVVTKLLPLLQSGDPPTYRSIYTGLENAAPPLGWEMSWNGKPLGWAVTSQSTKDKYTTVESHVRFNHLPFDDLVPVLLRGMWHSSGTNLGQVRIDAESKIVIDPTGQLQVFHFVITSPNVPDPIRVSGQVRDGKLHIHVIAAGNRHIHKLELPADAVLGNDLSPQSRLPGLYVGQTWTVPVYSPFRLGGGNPVEMLQAKVERQDALSWDDELVPVLLVVLRRDAGALLSGSRTPRAKLWVDQTGEVLKQESYLQNSKLTFTRTDERQAKLYWEARDRIRSERTKSYVDNESFPSPDSRPEIELPLPFFSGGGENLESANQRDGKEAPSPDAALPAWQRSLRGIIRALPREGQARPLAPADDPWTDLDPLPAPRDKPRIPADAPPPAEQANPQTLQRPRFTRLVT